MGLNGPDIGGRGHVDPRALFGLAETGLVLLDPVRIVPDMHAAYREPVVSQSDYAVFMTGPSATADIEGVLIHGAQGIRSLTVVPLPSR